MEAHGNEVVEIDVKEMFFILLHELCLIAIIGILFAICTGLASIYLLAPTLSPCSGLCKNMFLGAFGGILFTLVFLTLGRLQSAPGYDPEDLEKFLGRVMLCSVPKEGEAGSFKPVSKFF